MQGREVEGARRREPWNLALSLTPTNGVTSGTSLLTSIFHWIEWEIITPPKREAFDNSELQKWRTSGPPWLNREELWVI